MSGFVIHLALACLPVTVLLTAGLWLRRFISRNAVARYQLLALTLVATAIILPAQILWVEVSGLAGAADPTVTLPKVPSPTEAEAGKGSWLIATTELPSRERPDTADARTWLDGTMIYRLLMVVYFAGLVIYLAWVLARLLRTCWMLSSCQELPPHEVEALFRADASSQIGRIRFLSSTRIDTPACAWFRRPMILVPSDFTQRFTTDQIRCILQHELVHVTRRDWITSLIGHWLQATFWFHPLVWLFLRSMNIDRELSCDALVARRTGSPKTYARTLLHVCLKQNESRLSLVPIGPHVSIQRRIEMLSYYQMTLSYTSRLVLLSASVLVAGSVVLAQIGVLRAAEVPPLRTLKTVPSSLEAPADDQSEASPPVVGTVAAIPTGRSPREIYDHIRMGMEAAGHRMDDRGWITNAESIVSAENARISDSTITALEVRLNLPEGSKLRAEFLGRRVAMVQEAGASNVEIVEGQVSIGDTENVMRAIAQLRPGAPENSKILVRTTFDRDEVTMLVTGRDPAGEKIEIQVSFDVETGKPTGEDDPPHGAIRYELRQDPDNKSAVVKMLWRYHLGTLRQEAGR